MAIDSSAWTHEADIVIVGAGTAGCVLASRLSEDPTLRVLLIEAGGSDAHPYVRMPVGFMKALMRPEMTWGYSSEPEPHLNGRVLPIPRGRLLGGSSSINGMFHIRGHRLDFDDWAAAGCSGWSYAELLPYFRRSETSWRGEGPYHGGSGPLQVNRIDTRRLLAEPLREAAARAGGRANDDYDGEHHDGIAPGEVAIDRRGRRHSSARAYLHPALQRPNLQAHSHAQVQRVVVEAGRAVGVEFIRGGQRRRLRATREVLLCGGAYGSPQLLMLSGIGPGEHLQPLGIEVAKHLPSTRQLHRVGPVPRIVQHPELAARHRKGIGKSLGLGEGADRRHLDNLDMRRKRARVDGRKGLRIVCFANKFDFQPVARPDDPFQRRKQVGHYVGLFVESDQYRIDGRIGGRGVYALGTLACCRRSYGCEPKRHAGEKEKRREAVQECEYKCGSQD